MEPVIKKTKKNKTVRISIKYVNFFFRFFFFLQKVRDELDRNEGLRRGEKQPGDPVRQIHTAVSGEHPEPF